MTSSASRYGAGGVQLFDLGSVETELPENFVIVLTKTGRAVCGFLGNAVHLHGILTVSVSLPPAPSSGTTMSFARNCGSSSTSLGSTIAPYVMCALS
jgi:hypothetical protein